VYGPYNDADKTAARGTYWNPVSASDVRVPRFFLDAFDNPVLYYRFWNNMYYTSDNGIIRSPEYTSDQPTPGPTDANSYPRNVEVPGTPYFRTDFILMTRGADGAWPPSYDPRYRPGSDDVTNFFLNK
jgi:hypothetical protein